MLLKHLSPSISQVLHRSFVHRSVTLQCEQLAFIHHHARFGDSRQIVPFSQDEQNKGPFVNYLAERFKPENHHRVPIRPAFDALCRMISLFTEHAADRDFAHASPSSSSASASASSSSSLSCSSRASSEPDHSLDLPPFSKTVWRDRLIAALKRGQEWVEGETVYGDHHPHCDAVSDVFSSSSFCMGIWLLSIVSFRLFAVFCIICCTAVLVFSVCEYCS